jgi:VWFA-related protein
MQKRFVTYTFIVAAFMLTTIAAVPLAPQAGNQGQAQGNSQAPQSGKNGQQQSLEQPQYKLSIRSNLVLVPVIVTDRHGDHVPGLKAEDFEVREDDKPQSIVRADEVTVGDTGKVDRPAVAANTFSNELVAEHPKKLEIIALDQINVPFVGGADGNRMLVEFLSKNVDANTLLALVALTHNGVRIIHDFSSDPSLLVAAVRKARNKPSALDATTMDVSGENSALDIEVLQLNALLSGADVDLTGLSPAQAMAQLRAINASQRATADASRRAQEALITLECFQQIAEYFGGVPGRKSMIWATSGFPFGLGAGVNNSVTRGTQADDWDRTFRMLTDANIAVYPVDITGLTTGATANNLQQLNTTLIKTGGPEGGVAGRSAALAAVEGGQFNDPNVSRQETMRQLAERTGGQPFYNSNDGAELFRRAGADAGQYYTLAYYTKDTGKYGWRKLNIKVKRDGVRVRARSGYYFNDPKKAGDPSTAVRDLKMSLMSDLSFTSVPLRGEWLQTEPAGDQRKVHFVLSIPPGVPAIDSEHENHISLEFLVQASDKAGKNVANISQRLDTKLKPDGVDQIQNRGLDYTNVLTLAPGDYKVHMVVRDNLRGTLGSLVTPLKVN